MKTFTISSVILMMLISGAHAADEFGAMFTQEAPAALMEEPTQDPMDILAAGLQEIAPAAGDEDAAEVDASPMNAADQTADNPLNENDE